MLPEGVVDCRVCGVPTQSNSGEICDDCSEDCDACAATGMCGECDGSGGCADCGRSGDPDCETCAGLNQCEWCGGSGKCDECNGTGERQPAEAPASEG